MWRAVRKNALLYWQRVHSAEKIGETTPRAAILSRLRTFDELRDEDTLAIEYGDRIVTGEPLCRKAALAKVTEQRRVTLDALARSLLIKHARHPRVSIVPVDAMHADVKSRDGAHQNSVTRCQVCGDGLVAARLV